MQKSLSFFLQSDLNSHIFHIIVLTCDLFKSKSRDSLACVRLTCVAVSLGERVERSFGFGGPVGGAGAEGAGGQGLAQVV